jgi:hypothetical protein
MILVINSPFDCGRLGVHGGLAHHFGRQSQVGGAVDAGDRQQLRFHRRGEDAGVGVALGAGDRTAVQRCIDVAVPVGDDLGAVAHQRQHEQVAIAGVHLLPRAQRPLDDHRRRGGQLHLDDVLRPEHRRDRGLPARRPGTLGRFDPTGGERGDHLLGAAPAHCQRHHAVPAQQRNKRSEVDGLVDLPHTRQVDRHGLVVEKTRHQARALFVLGRQRIEVGGLQHHGNQCERGAPHSRMKVATSLETTAMQWGTRKRMSLSTRVVAWPRATFAGRDAQAACDRHALVSRYSTSSSG